jgi:hypothetical protein
MSETASANGAFGSDGVTQVGSLMYPESATENTASKFDFVGDLHHVI